VVLGIALLSGLVAARAVAQEQAPDPALQEAKAAFEEAQVMYTKEQYAEAGDKFLSAYDKKPFSSFLYNAAVAYEKARQMPKAIETFERYIHVDPQARDAVEVKGRIDSLRASLAPAPAAAGKEPQEKQAVLPALSTKGLVIIESKPAGANVFLNEVAAGVFATTPWQGSLEPKPVRLIFEAKGFKRETREINPRPDKITELYIAMSEEHFLGWIEVVSNVPGADVFIDRLEIGAIGHTPYTGHLKPGKHMLWVQRPGYQTAQKEITVEPGTATSHALNLELIGYGTLKANKSTEGGKLIVDGAPACNLPCEQQLKPGDHSIVIRKEDMEDYVGKLTVNRADLTSMDVNYSPKPSRVRAWSYSVLSAALFGGGIFLGLQGNKVKDEIKADANDLSKLNSNHDSRTTTGKYYYIGADACLGLGVITTALAVWNFLESGPPSTATYKTNNIAGPAPSKLGFAPIQMPGGAGVAAAGSF
jgi:tetratricopeptide (TPR) repeat protein